MPITNAHDFHLSKCEVEYNLEEKAVQISLQIFIDDLELALTTAGTEKLYLFTKKEHPDAQQYIIDYIYEKLKIEVDEQLVEFQYLGNEMSDDLAAVWCYLEIPGVSIQSQFAIENTLLFEVFEDQRNLTKVKLSKSTKGHYLFDHKDFRGELNF